MKQTKRYRITVLGAGGNVGRRIVAEALDRGHQVTAVVRDPAQFSRLPAAANHRSGDAGRPDDVATLVSGQDVLISAVRPPVGEEQRLVDMTQAILSGAARSGVRVLMVGGAASLKIPDDATHTVLTQPGFLPEHIVPIARACFAQYEACLADEEADWTYLSPPGMLEPGERTGQFRLGTDELLVDEKGVSSISMEDFAVAMIDEVERARHRRSRFTVAY